MSYLVSTVDINAVIDGVAYGPYETEEQAGAVAKRLNFNPRSYLHWVVVKAEDYPDMHVVSEDVRIVSSGPPVNVHHP